MGPEGEIYVLLSAPSPVLSSVLYSPLTFSPPSLLSACSAAAGFFGGPVFAHRKK